MKALALLLLAPVALVTLALPAYAQVDDETIGQVEVTFDTGPFDASVLDWPVRAVELRGGLLAGEVEVVVSGDSGPLWTKVVVFTPPVARIVVDEFVAVADVTRVSVRQRFLEVTTFEVLDVVTDPEPVPDADPAAEPEVVIVPAPIVPETEEAAPTADPPTATPPIVGGVVDQPVQVLGGGSGRSAGNLTVSVIVSFVVLVLAFRTPLPAGTTQRWRA